MFIEITNFIIYFTGTFCLILSMGELAIRDKKPVHYTISLMFFSIGLVTIHFGMETTGHLDTLSHFMRINIPFIFMIGPLVYLYFRQIIDQRYILTKKHSIHFIPALGSAFYHVSFYIMTGLEKIVKYDSLDLHFSNDLHILYILGNLSILIYTAIAFGTYMKLFGLKTLLKKGPVRSITAVSGGLIILFFLMLISQILHSVPLFRINYILGLCIILTIYVLSQRYHQFLHNFTREAGRSRYERSQIGGIQPDAIIKRLKELMELEELYKDDEISLATVSETLQITSHQLSEILNQWMNISFKSFINGYRISEAKRLLESSEELPILHIAYESGFRSKTTFNTLFQKDTGVSPSEYRKRILTKLCSIL